MVNIFRDHTVLYFGMIFIFFATKKTYQVHKFWNGYFKMLSIVIELMKAVTFCSRSMKVSSNPFTRYYLTDAASIHDKILLKIIV